jgi:cell division protein FtsA
MRRNQIYVGLEIGTSKVCIAVGEVKTDGTIKILGVGETPSRGVKKGEIIDSDAIEICIQDALLRAEDHSDVMIRSVFLSVTGEHIQSENKRGEHDIPLGQGVISLDDVDDAKEKARSLELPPQNIFLHSIVRRYFVDGQEAAYPAGMVGQKLEADYHIIHGVRSRIQNAIRSVRKIPLDVEDVVFGPIASAQVVLKHGDRGRGALVVDIGGGTTDYVLYNDGSVVATGCLPLGGDTLTSDLSIVTKIALHQAERLKRDHGSADPAHAHLEGMVSVEADSEFSGKEIEVALMNQVIQARLGEIFHLLKKRLSENQMLAAAGSGVFLTGGTSLLKGIDVLCGQVLELPVRRTSGQSVNGLTATFENPQYHTPIGLIRYAQILDGDRPAATPLTKLKQRLGSVLSGSKGTTSSSLP